MVDADLYVLLGDGGDELWNSLRPDFGEDRPRRFAFREEIVEREPQDGPVDWRHVLVHLPEQVVRKRATPARMSLSRLVQIPDTHFWSPLRIVSRRLREFLTEEFPDGSAFYSMSYVNDGTGEIEATDFSYWLPRHLISFHPQEERHRYEAMIPQSKSCLGRHDTTYEMYHNRNFQGYIADFPFWTPSPTFSEIAFRRDVYHRLRKAGFSGFVEALENTWLRQEPHQTVDYVQFKK